MRRKDTLAVVLSVVCQRPTQQTSAKKNRNSEHALIDASTNCTVPQCVVLFSSTTFVLFFGDCQKHLKTSSPLACWVLFEKVLAERNVKMQLIPQQDPFLKSWDALNDLRFLLRLVDFFLGKPDSSPPCSIFDVRCCCLLWRFVLRVVFSVMQPTTTEHASLLNEEILGTSNGIWMYWMAIIVKRRVNYDDTHTRIYVESMEAKQSVHRSYWCD